MRTHEATSLQPIVAGISDMGSGRLGATAAAAIGLIGIVIGGRALARSTGRTRADDDSGAVGGLRAATVALVLGLIGTILGVVFIATAGGGLGTGNGLGGAIVAVVLGLAGVVLGGLARARSEKVA